MSQIALLEKAQKIRLLVLDVDGVMTNGQIHVLPDGSEVKMFSIHDGFGIVCAMKAGIRVAIISGRPSPAVLKRCQELQIEDVFMDHLDKLPVLNELMRKYDLTSQQVAFIGDDYPDLPVLIRVGLSAAPQNAHPEVKNRVDIQLQNRGGEGAVRELIDLLLRAHDQDQELLRKYVPRELDPMWIKKDSH